MTRRCADCKSYAHTGESCAKKRRPSGGGAGEGEVILFGVRLTDGSSSSVRSSNSSMLNLSLSAAAEDSDVEYQSDDPDRGSVSAASSSQNIRKKAIPWTEEEHRQFLIGLQVLGKGDWLGISRNYVPSKTPSQVASHAQKYYIHQSNPLRKKRRLGVFDRVSDVETNPAMPELSSITSPAFGANGRNFIFTSSRGVRMESSSNFLELSLKPPSGPLPYQLWPPNAYPFYISGAGPSHQQVLRPVPAIPEEPIENMLRLTLGVTRTVFIDPSALSLRPPGMPMV